LKKQRKGSKMSETNEIKTDKMFSLKNESDFNRYLTSIGKDVRVGDTVSVDKRLKDILVKEGFKEVAS